MLRDLFFLPSQSSDVEKCRLFRSIGKAEEEGAGGEPIWRNSRSETFKKEEKRT